MVDYFWFMVEIKTGLKIGSVFFLFACYSMLYFFSSERAGGWDMIESVYCSSNSAVVSQYPVQSHFKSMSTFINPRGKHNYFNGM